MRYRLIAKCKRGNKIFRYQDVFFQKMATLENYVKKQKEKYGDNYSYFVKGINLEEICIEQEQFDSQSH